MPKITFLRDGTTLEVPVGASFLQVCQDNDAPHDFGCTVGSCGTCVLDDLICEPAPEAETPEQIGHP